MNKREYIIAGTLAAVRSGHDFDTADLIARLGAMYDLIPAEAVEAGEWTYWAGGDYPKGRVDVELRDGSTRAGEASDDLIWDVDGLSDDIVKWRPAR